MEKEKIQDNNLGYPDLEYKTYSTSLSTIDDKEQSSPYRKSPGTSVLSFNLEKNESQSTADSNSERSKMSSGVGSQVQSDFGSCGKFTHKTYYSKTETINRYDDILLQYFNDKKAIYHIRQQVFQKYVNVIKILSKKEHIYVATYELLQNDIKNRQDGHASQFSFKMDRGDASFLLESVNGQKKNDYQFVQRLWKDQNYKTGPCLFLTSIIKGTIELQNSKIFHQDLHYRNSIKVPEKRVPGGWIFKIIDFDWALDVSGSQRWYFNTLELIKKWFQKRHLPIDKHILFRDQYVDIVTSLFLQKLLLDPKLKCTKQTIMKEVEHILNQDQNIEFKADMMCECLKAYSYFYHKVQILFLLYTTLIGRIEEKKLRDILQTAISVDTTSLKTCNRDLQMLVECLQK